MTEIVTEISAEEKPSIIRVVAEHTGMDLQEISEQLEGRSVVQIQDYIDDGPGFCGDLFFIVWGWAQRVSFLSHSNDEWRVIFDGDISDVTPARQQPVDTRKEQVGLKRHIVLFTRKPTNYNPQQRAIVESETPEDAERLVKRSVGDEGLQFHNYAIEGVFEYVEEKIDGQVVSIA